MIVYCILGIKAEPKKKKSGITRVRINGFQVDASFNESDNLYGIGILYWIENQIIDIKVFAGITSSAEAFAIQKAVKWALKLQLRESKLQSNIAKVWFSF